MKSQCKELQPTHYSLIWIKLSSKLQQLQSPLPLLFPQLACQPSRQYPPSSLHEPTPCVNNHMRPHLIIYRYLKYRYWKCLYYIRNITSINLPISNLGAFKILTFRMNTFWSGKMPEVALSISFPIDSGINLATNSFRSQELAWFLMISTILRRI